MMLPIFRPCFLIAQGSTCDTRKSVKRGKCGKIFRWKRTKHLRETNCKARLSIEQICVWLRSCVNCEMMCVRLNYELKRGDYAKIKRAEAFLLAFILLYCRKSGNLRF